MKRRAKREIYFAVCINNKSYEASLEVGQLYRIIPDEAAESRGYLRIVDESGEDYGYSADRFSRLEVPRRWNELWQGPCLKGCPLPNPRLEGLRNH